MEQGSPQRDDSYTLHDNDVPTTMMKRPSNGLQGSKLPILVSVAENDFDDSLMKKPRTASATITATYSTTANSSASSLEYEENDDLVNSLNFVHSSTSRSMTVESVQHQMEESLDIHERHDPTENEQQQNSIRHRQKEQQHLSVASNGEISLNHQDIKKVESKPESENSSIFDWLANSMRHVHRKDETENNHLEESIELHASDNKQYTNSGNYGSIDLGDVESGYMKHETATHENKKPNVFNRVSRFLNNVDPSHHHSWAVPGGIRPEEARGSFLWKKARRDLISVILGAKDKENEVTKEIPHRISHGRVGRRSQIEQVKEEYADHVRKQMTFSAKSAVIAILVYLTIAAVAFHLIFEPQWSVIDCLYFAMVTLTTVGYGDMTPTNNASRIFSCFYSLGGLSVLGLALGILGGNLVEAQQKAMKHASKLSQAQVMTLFNFQRENRDVFSMGNELEIERRFLDWANSASPTTAWYKSHLCQLVPLVIFLFIGSFLIAKEADWDISRTLYFFVTTSATIGYGDEAPQSQLGRLFAIFFIPLCVYTMGEWLSTTANIIMEYRQAEFRKQFQNRELTLTDILAMDLDGDSQVSRSEYLEFMLVAMNQVDRSLIQELNSQFDDLDVDGTGVLDRHDLIIKAKSTMKSAKRKLELSAYKKKLLEAANESRDSAIHKTWLNLKLWRQSASDWNT